MRIAFDYQIFGSQEYGGISRYIYELAAEFAKTPGTDVAVIAPLSVNRYLKGAPKNLQVLGISVPRLPKTASLYRAANVLLSWPAMRYFRPDIVHETYYSSRRTAPGRAKVVLTVYDMIHERFSGEFPAADTVSRDKAVAVARADHLICISEQTRQDLIELLDVDPAKTSVIHLGFSLTSGAAAGQGKTGHRPFLLYVGNREG
jgi:glycosyltransferase involved in cell wall biosynthesis